MDRYGAWAIGTALVAAAIGAAVAGAVAASSLAAAAAPAIASAMVWVVSGILWAPIGAIAGLVAWLPVGAWIALHAIVKEAHRDATAGDSQGDPERLAEMREATRAPGDFEGLSDKAYLAAQLAAGAKLPLWTVA